MTRLRTYLLALVLALVSAAPARATVSTTTSVVEYTCNGTVKVFTVPYRFLASTDLRVSRVLLADPYTESLLPIATVYTVTGAGSATGGTVSLVTPSTGCATGYKLRIRRLTAKTQGTALSTQGPYNPKALEAMADRQAMIAQELNDGSLIGNRWFDFTVQGPPDVAMLTATGSPVPRSLADRAADVVNVKDYGATGDGATDDTTALRAVATAADGRNVTIVFPPGSYRTKFLTFSTGKVRLQGNGAKIVQLYDTAADTGGGSTKVSPFVLIKRGASQVEVTGFEFTQDASTFPVKPTYESYYAPVVAHRATHVSVHHNVFNLSATGRGLFNYGSSQVDFSYNTGNAGTLSHIGYTSNANFWDATTDTTTHYSPHAITVIGNKIIGYALQPAVAIFMSGAQDFVVRDNQLLGFNVPNGRAIEGYINDAGPTDMAGNPVRYLNGTIEGNSIECIDCDIGIMVQGWGSVAPYTGCQYMQLVGVKTVNNNVYGTGVDKGIQTFCSSGSEFRHNRIEAVIPLSFAGSLINGITVADNIFVGSGSEGLASITPPETIDFVFQGNTVDIPSAHDRGFGSALKQTNLKVNGNSFRYNGTADDASLLYFTNLDGVSSLSDNTFTIQNAAFPATGRLATFTGQNAGCGVVIARNVLSPASAYRPRGISTGCLGTLVLSDNLLPSLDTSSAAAQVIARGNILANGSFAGAPLAFYDSPGNVIAEGNIINVTGDYSGINLGTGSVRTSAVGNTIIGSSSAALIKQWTDGTLNVSGNMLINGGSGGLYGVSGTATMVPTAQADSTASDVAGLVADFNALLAKLRASGAVAP